MIVASPNFAKSFKLGKGDKKYLQLPHLLCDRLNPDKMLAILENKTTLAARFNDLAFTRAACIQGIGWALLPLYAVQAELDSGQLVQIDSQSFGKAKYGVWRLRGRSYLKAYCDQISSWLVKQRL